MSIAISQFILGAIFMGEMVAGGFFLRFWQSTRDRLFIYFAAAFWLEAATRAVLAFNPSPWEGDPKLYIIRCVSYCLIVIGVWDKNRRS